MLTVSCSPSYGLCVVLVVLTLVLYTIHSKLLTLTLTYTCTVIWSALHDVPGHRSDISTSEVPHRGHKGVSTNG